MDLGRSGCPSTGTVGPLRTECVRRVRRRSFIRAKAVSCGDNAGYPRDAAPAGPRSLFLASLRGAITELRRRTRDPAAPDARAEGRRPRESRAGP
ncbi:hypothetical protein FMEAI12_4330010 [Parafrankia sp. Ea1.12]|nr:hypothetical protein FMEAI12_4330010 [Parafrankia sp. Ea1.12]